MKRAHLARAALALGLAFLTACGATGIGGTAAAPAASSKAGETAYTRVLVRDFGDEVSPNARGAMGAKELEMNQACRKFSDQIASAIERAGVFESVSRRGRATAGTLVVEGDITAFVEGNVVGGIPIVGKIFPTSDARKFAATVHLRDGASGRQLDTFRVDEDSSPAGNQAPLDTTDMTVGPAETVASRVVSRFAGPAGAAATAD